MKYTSILPLTFLLCGGLASGGSFRPLTFQELVQGAGVIARGTVVKLEPVVRGVDIRREKNKTHVAPQVSPAAPTAPGAGPEGPVAVDVEGGRMVFTRVEFQVRDMVAGTVDGPLVFEVAGGVGAGVEVTVAGLPRFVLGAQYILFLRDPYVGVGDPIVGGNQGCFEVIRAESDGREIVLNPNGDFVLGVEEGRIVARRRATGGSDDFPRLGPPPEPTPGSTATVQRSPSVTRYWESKEEPMSADDFIQAIRNVR